MEATQSAADEMQQDQDDNNGAYVLRDLMRDVPLSEHGDNKDIYITCVEAWGASLLLWSADSGLKD